MTTPLPIKNSTQANREEYDDLTRLKGIGSVKQQWLRESLNIRTFRELATLSADEIESRLKAKGQTVSKSEIEGWIAQAQEIVAVEERSPQPIVESPNTEAEAQLNLPTQEDNSVQAILESADTEVEENLTCSGEDGLWRTFASFLTEFQFRQTEEQTEEQRTTIRHLETENVQTWSGIENEKLHQWIASQLDTAKPPLPEVQSPIVVSPMKVEIEEIRILQPPQTETPIVINRANRLFCGIIRSDQPLVLEVAFQLAEISVPDIPKGQFRYLVQGYVRDRSTRAITPLGETILDSLVENQQFYKVRLPATTLEQPGMYRLQVLVTPQGTPATPAYCEVPLLPVV